jgi:F-type H+-transporting ATPase subunit alpha
MLSYLRADHADLLKSIRDSKDLGDEPKKKLVAALDAFGKTFA